jgi:hypothetical protein
MKAKLAGALPLVLAAVATFVGILWWSLRGGSEAPAVTPGVTVRAEPQATAPTPAGASVQPAPPQAQPAAETDADAAASEASFRGFVEDKYRYLLRRNNTMSPEARAALQAALLERERIAALIRTARQSRDDKDWEAIPQHRADLEAVERKIGSLLPPESIMAFELLKESDREQYQLQDYAGGISNYAPLNDDDKQSIIMTKLAHRQRFMRVLEESRLTTGELTPAQRKTAFAEVSRALTSARDGYLREVRQYLYNDDQYQFLANYENTEFATELESLRRLAYGE